MAVRVGGRAVVALLLAIACAAAGVAVSVGGQAPAAVPKCSGGESVPALAPSSGADRSAALVSAGEGAAERTRDEGSVQRALLIEVVCAASGRAMAGADVWLLERRADRVAPATGRWLPGVATGPPEPWPGAPWGRTGADGTALLPRPDGPAWLLARWGRLEGACRVGADGAPPDTVRVPLVPIRRLTVVALDALGNAAGGVPIALRPAARAPADPASIAPVPLGVTSSPFGTLSVDLEPWAGSSDAVEVGIDVPGLPWRGERVLPGAPPANAVCLHVGAIGALTVRVLRADGSPAPAGLAVQLGARDPAGGVMAFLRTCLVAATDAQGCAVFPVFGSGVPSWVRVVAPGQVVVRALDAAVADEPERRVTCVLPEPRFVVRGRALDGRKEPLRGAKLQLTWQVGAARRSRSAAATTDDRGAFAFALGGGDGGTMRSARVARVIGGLLADQGAALGDVPLPDRGDVQLGDLRLMDAAVLAAGRIVGAGDAADVVLWVEDGEDGGAQCAGAWVERTAADAFVVRGEARSPGLRLCAGRDGVACGAPVAFAAGDRGLVMRVPAVAAPPSAPAMVSGDAVRVSRRAARLQPAGSAR